MSTVDRGVPAPSRERITVWVEGQRRKLLLGMRVRHAVGYDAVRLVEHGEAQVVNEQGYRVDLDGALYNGQRLVVRKESPGGAEAVPGC